MANLTKFRSAVGGFNRTDVVNYIESISAEQQRQLRRLQEEKEQLEAEKAAAEEALAAANCELAALREQDESLAQQVTTLSIQASELAGQAKLERARADELAGQLAALTPADTSEDAQNAGEASEDAQPDYESLELAAYRRAEQAERTARERADKVYSQLSALCERAQERYSDAGDEIAALSEDLSVGLERLQQTLAELRIVSEDAQNEFDALELPAPD